MADSGRTPRHQVAPARLTRNEKGKAKIEETPDVDDDEKRRVSNINPCFSRALSPLDVYPSKGKPRLFLNAKDASRFFECPGIETIYGLGKLRENLVVFDAGNTQYDMLLSYSMTDSRFIVDAGWQRFVKIHTLTDDDHIFFYRISNENVHDKSYYEVQYIRNSIPGWRGVSGAEENYLPGENWPPELKSPKPGPGSRFLPENTICLSKYLGETEVNGLILLLNEGDAGFLIGCGDMKAKYCDSTLIENLVVFDTDDKQYDMLLTQCTSYPLEASYCIDAGWQRFVHIHNLKIDDVILFHRLIDKAVHDEPYYVVRYIRNKFPGGDVVTGVTPSSSGGFFQKLIDSFNKAKRNDPYYAAGPSGYKHDGAPAVVTLGPYGRANVQLNIISRPTNPKLNIRPQSVTKGWNAIIERGKNLLRYSRRRTRNTEEEQVSLIIELMMPEESESETERRLIQFAKTTGDRTGYDAFSLASFRFYCARGYRRGDPDDWTREQFQALIDEPRY